MKNEIQAKTTLEAARIAEAKLAAIARTRRPTETETAEARRAYDAASLALNGQPAQDAKG